jgi:hypothetical protein
VLEEHVAPCCAVRIELVFENICPTIIVFKMGKSHFVPNSAAEVHGKKHMNLLKENNVS